MSTPQEVVKAPTSLAAFIGVFPKGPVETPVTVDSWSKFAGEFGELGSDSTHAVRLFFQNGGDGASIVRLPDESALLDALRGSLDRITPARLNILCIPELASLDAAAAQQIYGSAHLHCEQRGAVLLVDPPAPTAAAGAPGVGNGVDSARELIDAYSGFLGADKVAAALYYPWLEITDPATQRQRLVPPSGAVAGVYARIDRDRGVWTAPAGADAALEGVTGTADGALDNTANGELTVTGMNAVRTFPAYGTVVWGARTMAGGDLLDSTFKYVAVWRLKAFIEQSLRLGTGWAASKPSDEQLWSSLAIEASRFMSWLAASGACAPTYTVACDANTTSPADALNGIANVEVGFQPADPAEFVLLKVALKTAPTRPA